MEGQGLVLFIMWMTSVSTLVTSPDQMFHVCHADSSNNRVRKLSIRKLGQVYMYIGYIISYQQWLLWCQKIASRLFVMTHNAIFFIWEIWLVRQPVDTLLWLCPSSVKVSRSYFSTRPQGAYENLSAWGQDYVYLGRQRRGEGSTME